MERKILNPIEICALYAENGWTDEDLYQMCIGNGDTEERAKWFVRRVMHPTPEEVKVDESLTDEDKKDYIKHHPR